MGMSDTIYLSKAYFCPKCHAKIDSTQTKAFENMFYKIGCSKICL